MQATVLIAAANAQLVAAAVLVARIPQMAASTPVPSSFMNISRTTLERQGTGSAAPASNRYSLLSWSVELSSPSRMLLSFTSFSTAPTSALAGYLNDRVGGMDLLTNPDYYAVMSSRSRALYFNTNVLESKQSPGCALRRHVWGRALRQGYLRSHG